MTVEEYGNVFKDLGYTNVRAEDKTDMFVHYLKVESAEFEGIQDSFVKVIERLLNLLFLSSIVTQSKICLIIFI